MNATLSVIPLLILLFCLLLLKMDTRKAASYALLSAIVIAWFFFGMDISGLAIAISKGMSLALYVLLIIWAAIFLYHLVYEFKAIDVINKNIVLFIKDPFIQFLTLSWLFSSVLQGIAGFGVPVVIVVPILINLGFDPLKAVSAVLLGHSWSVSFGSMGSSFSTITLVTNLDQQSIGFSMLIFGSLAMILMGISVCYIYGGWKYVKKGLSYILPVSLVMIVIQILVITVNLFSLVGLMSSLSGLITIFVLYSIRKKPGIPKKLFESSLTLSKSVLPYTLIIMFSLLFQIFDFDQYYFSFKYPAYITNLGYSVAMENNYAKIKIFGHPAPIIMMSSIITIIVYIKAEIWENKKFINVLRKTVNKCTGTTISLVFLIAMALIMMDSGMTYTLSTKVSKITGIFYPLFAPLFGILGSFLTGSNTNSNILFGEFQVSVAKTLVVNPFIMAGVQSISGSIGVSLGPTTILMASSASGLNGQESNIYSKVIKPVILTAILMGILNYLLLVVFKTSIGGL